MDSALKYLGYRARTVREMEYHLDECLYGEYEIMQTVERLEELGYLNDLQFARDFIDSRLRTKPVSRAHLKEQLKNHHCAPDAIEEALAEITDEQEQLNATAVARDLAEHTEGTGYRERRERIMRKLVTRGYSYETSAKAFSELKLEEDGD